MDRPTLPLGVTLATKMVLKSLFVILLFVVLYLFFLVLFDRKKKKISNYWKKSFSSRNVAHKDDDASAVNKNIAQKRNPLVEYPSFDLSAGGIERFSVTSANNSEFHRIETYTYTDLVSVVTTKDAKFFSRAAASKKASFAAKRAIYEKLIKGAATKLQGDSTNPHTQYDEARSRSIRLVERCNMIIKAIDTADITPANVFADYRQILWDRDYGLENLVGRLDVKNAFSKKVFAFIADPTISYTDFQNQLITGSTGIGKTTLCKILSKASSLAGLTVLGSDRNPPVLSPDCFESQFVGGTPKKVADIFIDSLEEPAIGDELYNLTPSMMDRSAVASYGKQAINLIVALMSEFEGLSHFYAIGYKEQMINDFLPSNEGLDRRFPERMRVDLENYTPKELTMILIRYLINPGCLDIGDKTAATIYSLVKTIYDERPTIFKLQASAMIDLGRYIIQSIKGAKNVSWTKGDDVCNSEILIWCYNDYMAQNYGIALRSDTLQ